MKLPQNLNVLLLGSGGREHALAWKIARSKRIGKLYIAPGNAGTGLCGTNIDLNLSNFASIKQFIVNNSINLVVVGPEEPLVKGIYDFFNNDDDIKHVPLIGPSMQGARLEGSKDFAKAFMTRNGIPTAAYRSFTKATIEEGYAFLDSLKAPYVLKADGLAAGKGVVICESIDQAKRELGEMLLEAKFSAASSRVVIEEYLNGIELSVFVLTDGESYKILPEAKDYKRIGEGDTGPNTGGMGAVSPVPFADAAFMDKVHARIVEPTVEGLKKENIPYKGFIFIGLMNVAGDPYVIEYNVRLGDPETEVVMPRIKSDIMDLFEGVVYGSLEKKEIEIDPRTAVTVVCVSQGYPGDYSKGLPIRGLDIPSESLTFHAGTVLKKEGVFTNGGRVLAVTSFGDSIEEAAGRSYDTIASIDYDGKYLRRDIGQDLK